MQAEPGESTASHDPCYEVTATTITVQGPLGLVRCDHLANPDAEEEQSADSDGENEERLFHARSCKRPDTALTHSQACDCRSWQPTAASSRAFSRGRKKLAWPLADAISHLLCNFAIDQVLRGRRMTAAYAAVISEVPVSLRFLSYPRKRRETDWELGKMSQLVARNGTASRLIHRGEAQKKKACQKSLHPNLELPDSASDFQVG